MKIWKYFWPIKIAWNIPILKNKTKILPFYVWESFKNNVFLDKMYNENQNLGKKAWQNKLKSC